MLKLNKYSLVSLFLATILTACGGGGGSASSSDGVGNTPATNTAIMVTNNLVGPANQIVAGHTFTITAKLTQGTGSTVSFTNGINTPSSITYAPASCNLTSSANSCTTTVTVKLPTAAIALNPGYSTNISASGSNAPAQKVTFAVTTPTLQIDTQPAATVIIGGNTTNAKFSLPSTSIPTGTGKIDVNLSASNSSIVTLDKSACEIQYTNALITNNTCSVTINASNQGSTNIIASANYFTSISTNQITVEAPAPTPTIKLDTSLNNTGGNVIAGQSFTITATSINDATSDISFSNAESTLTSVTYAPSTCHVTPSRPCTTRVSIGVATPPATTYKTNVVYSGGSEIPNTSVNFAVTQPQLAVLTNPEESIAVGSNTTVAFTIESGMVPDESDSIVVNLASTNGLAGFVTINPTTCIISYDKQKITNNACSNISVTAGSQIGSTQIYATANNFIQAKSSILEITPGTAPTVAVVSSIQGNNNIIYSGQSFNLNVNSVNGGTGPLTFSATDPKIVLNTTSCDLPAGGSCVVKISAPLDLTGYHGVNVSYYGESITEYTFTVNAPQLEFTSYAFANTSSILKGNDFYVTFGIVDGQVPDGNGQLTVNLSANPTNVVTVQPTCTITYSNNQMVGNGCVQVTVNAANYGISQITASANNFISTTSNPTITPQNITYVSGLNQIKLFAGTGNGILSAINTLSPITIESGSTYMALQTINSNQFLYLINAQQNQMLTYLISNYNGIPQYKTSIATGKKPKIILFSPTKPAAYVLNSDSTISQYSVSSDGTIQSLGSAVAAPSTGVTMAINPKNGTVYVLAQTSATTKNPYIAIYQPGATLGKLVFDSNGNVDLSSGTAQDINISPDGSRLAIAMSNGVVSYLLKTDGTINANSRQFLPAPGTASLNGIYFAPYLFGAQNFSVAYASNDQNLYQLLFQGTTAPSLTNNTLTFNTSSPKYMMGFTSKNGLTTDAQVYTYIANQTNSTIRMYMQDSSNGNLTINTTSGSSGIIDAGMVPNALVVGPNL